MLLGSSVQADLNQGEVVLGLHLVKYRFFSNLIPW